MLYVLQHIIASELQTNRRSKCLANIKLINQYLRKKSSRSKTKSFYRVDLFLKSINCYLSEGSVKFERNNYCLLKNKTKKRLILKIKYYKFTSFYCSHFQSNSGFANKSRHAKLFSCGANKVRLDGLRVSVEG